MAEEGGVRVLEKRRELGAGLRMLLGQTVTFPRPVRAWNPRTSFMEEKNKMDIVFDASIPEAQYANYESYSVGKDSKGKILVLLASLGYSYPTTAIAEATGVAKSTSQRLLWELKRDGLLEGAYSTGSYVDSELWPYRYGHIQENYWMLSPEGSRRAEELMKMKVAALAPPRELVEKEMKEHPWLRPDEAERIVREHVEDTRRRVGEIRAKQARGETLTTQELKVIYGEKAVSKELREERERAEKAYVEAIAPTWKAHEEVTAPALKAHEEAMDRARKAFHEATAQAGKAFDEARAPALKADEKAMDQARKTYEEAMDQARKTYEEARGQTEKPETPWDAAGRRAEEARRKYDERT